MPASPDCRRYLTLPLLLLACGPRAPVAPSARTATERALASVWIANKSPEVSAILVFMPDGSFAGRLSLPVPPSNCTFGGSDRRSLYITTLHAIHEACADTPGLP